VRIAFIFALLLLPLRLLAVTTYVSQAGGLYSGAGRDCPGQTAISVATHNSSTFSPGQFIEVCGILTSEIVFPSSGSSGNPITYIFDVNAGMQGSPFFSTGISFNGQSYVTVNGEGSGFIENMLNGTAGAACPGGPCSSQAVSKAIDVSNASNVEITGLTFEDLYLHTSVSDTAISDSDVNCVYTNGIGNNLTIDSNTASDASWCLNLQFGNTASGLSIFNNNISRIDHGIALGGNPSGALSNINIYGNQISSFANWDTTADDYHHDGIHAYGNSSTITNLNIYNNSFSGPASTCSSSCMTGYIFIELSADVTNESIFNNLFTAQSTDIISSGGGLLGVYSGLSPVLIANNTVLGGGTGSALCFGANQTMTGVTLENNVFSTCNQLTDISHVTFTAFNYNVYAAAQSSNAFECGSTFYSSSQFAAFKTACLEGSSSIYTSSALLNSVGYPQSGSPVLRAGLNLTSLGVAALNSDYSGTPRPGSAAWDVGAYELLGLTPAPTTTMFSRLSEVK
jgi:hypothetical protein